GLRMGGAWTATASPSPKPATAVLMPTTRPAESARAPPELPGLRAASVWMTSSMSRMRRPPRAGGGGDRPPDGAAPAAGPGAGQAERVAHGDDELADPQRVRVAERGGR